MKTIDFIVTNNKSMIGEVNVGSSLGCSDHREIRFDLEWEENPNNNLDLVPDFRRANYEGIRRHIEKVNWEPLGYEMMAKVTVWKGLTII